MLGRIKWRSYPRLNKLAICKIVPLEFTFSAAVFAFATLAEIVPPAALAKLTSFHAAADPAQTPETTNPAPTSPLPLSGHPGPVS